VPQKRKQPVFVVPFFLDGRIDQMRVYSDVMKAQGALRRYVGYNALLRQVKDNTPSHQPQSLSEPPASGRMLARSPS